MGLGAAGGRKSAFPIDLVHGLYNSLYDTVYPVISYIHLQKGFANEHPI